MKILVINGPNLNMLGIREPDHYGRETYSDLVDKIQSYCDERGIEVTLFQSNHEGALVDEIQRAYGIMDGIVINPGAYTHTSIAILDAVKAVGIPTVEVHISDVEKREDYIKKAKEILDLHENWVIKAPIAGMHRSTLRWWETGWEGDGDGPAICAGHAWSIWRGEADYLYFELTGDASHLIKAQNTFMTNLSKINEKGESYANYNPDMINGGGFHCETSKINYKVATKFPTIKDSGLSRYVWIRINDTFLKDDLQPDEE